MRLTRSIGAVYFLSSDWFNNVTHIAQIRKRSRKCAATCQRQTEMFSVSV